MLIRRNQKNIPKKSQSKLKNHPKKYLNQNNLNVKMKLFQLKIIKKINMSVN